MTDPDPAVALTDLAARVAAFEAWRTHQSDLLNSHYSPVDLDTEADSEDITAVHALDTDALIAWVHDNITGVTARGLPGEYAWCPRWWEHPEAVFRFEALYRAWTELAPEPRVALSLWIRDHLDPCLRERLHPACPYADCAHTDRRPAHSAHRPLPTLPTQTP